MEMQYTIIKHDNTTWWFTPKVITAFDDAGMPMPKGLRTFLLRVKSLMLDKRERIELNAMGIGVLVENYGNDFFVKPL
jgi:hypothetical protein